MKRYSAGNAQSPEKRGCSACCSAVAWLPLLSMVMLAVCIPFWHIYIGRAQITLRAVLVALGTQLSGMDALFTGLDIARMVALVCLVTAAAMALTMAVVETGYNTKRHSYGGASTRRTTLVIGVEGAATVVMWLLLLVAVALLAGCLAWFACTWLGLVTMGQWHGTSASTQKAVSEGAAAANRYLDEIQAQAKEVLRTNAPPEQQAASWFSAALSGLDAFVSAERKKLEPSTSCPASCASFGPLATLSGLQDPCLCLVDRYTTVNTLLGIMQQQLLPALIAAGVALVAVSWLVPHAPVQLVHARYALQHRRRYKQEAARVYSGNPGAPPNHSSGPPPDWTSSYPGGPGMQVPSQPLQSYEVAGARPAPPSAGYTSYTNPPPMGPEPALVQATSPPPPSAPALPGLLGSSSSGGARAAGGSWGGPTAAGAGAGSSGLSLVPAGAAAPVVPPRRTSSSGMGHQFVYGDVEMAGRDADARSGSMRWGPVREELQPVSPPGGFGRSASGSGRSRRFQQVSL